MLSRPFLIAALLSVGACGGSDTDAPSQVAFQTLHQSSNSGVLSEQWNVVRDAAGWTALWAQHAGRSMPPPAEPAVDFASDMVLAVFLGTRPNDCYSVAIVRVLQQASMITVEYRETTPLPSQACAAVVTYPSHLVAVPAASAPVRFVRE